MTFTLLDDGALDELSSKIIAQLNYSIVEHVDSAHVGTTMTIRIALPERGYLATVTITARKALQTTAMRVHPPAPEYTSRDLKSAQCHGRESARPSANAPVRTAGARSSGRN